MKRILTVISLAMFGFFPFADRLKAQDQAGAVASFDGGPGTLQPNQFPGSAGSGWSAGWQEHTQGSTEATQATIVTNPDWGSGDPSLLVTKTATSGSYQLSRRVDLDQVNPGAPHRVRFQLHVNSFGDPSRPGIAAMATGPSPQADSMQEALWAISIEEGRWQFRAGTEEGAMEWIDSGIPLEAGQTVTLDIAVYPNTRSYRASIRIGESYYQTVNLPFARESPGIEPVEYWFGSPDESGDFSWALGPITIEPMVGNL